MKKNILHLLMILLFLIPADAKAQEWCEEDNYYAKIFCGANFLQNVAIRENKSNYHAGYIITGSAGFCLCDGLWLEAEYAFRRTAIRKIHFFGQGSSASGHFYTSSVMANLLWDLPLLSWGCAFWDIKPFIGAGVGCDFQKMHSSNSRIIFDQKWNHFSWQVMTGLAYPIFCNTEMTLEYKFHQGGSHFNNHSLGVGLVYKFSIP